MLILTRLEVITFQGKLTSLITITDSIKDLWVLFHSKLFSFFTILLIAHVPSHSECWGSHVPWLFPFLLLPVHYCYILPQSHLNYNAPRLEVIILRILKPISWHTPTEVSSFMLDSSLFLISLTTTLAHLCFWSYALYKLTFSNLTTYIYVVPHR